MLAYCCCKFFGGVGRAEGRRQIWRVTCVDVPVIAVATTPRCVCRWYSYRSTCSSRAETDQLTPWTNHRPSDAGSTAHGLLRDFFVLTALQFASCLVGGPIYRAVVASRELLFSFFPGKAATARKACRWHAAGRRPSDDELTAEDGERWVRRRVPFRFSKPAHSGWCVSCGGLLPLAAGHRKNSDFVACRADRCLVQNWERLKPHVSSTRASDIHNIKLTYKSYFLFVYNIVVTYLLGLKMQDV